MAASIWRASPRTVIVTALVAGTAGIVTIQDVVEELIGEVQDEFDLEAPLVEDRDDGSYSVDGGARIDYLEDSLGIQVPEEGFPTLGGRVFEQLQRRPRIGDEARLGNYRARVLEVDGMRICRVLLTRIDDGTGEESHLKEAENHERGGQAPEDS